MSLLFVSRGLPQFYYKDLTSDLNQYNLFDYIIL